MNYYISDLHLGHKNIINLDHRPFFDVEEMEETIVMNWNATVHKNDTVYILGDFCWNKADEWCRILKRLKGQKVLIEGNHDLGEYTAELKSLFADIKPYKEILDNGRKVIMSHYPILFYKKSNNPNYYMLCGHVHTTKENDYLERFIAEMKKGSLGEEGIHFKNCAKIYNVGAMMPWMAYTPRTLDEIIRNKDAFSHKSKNIKSYSQDEVEQIIGKE